jgi:hypothetical protein
MGRETLTFYCVLCLRVLTARRHVGLARFAHVARSVFVLRPDLHRPQRICAACEEQLLAPYEIVLRDGSVCRVLHTTSRLLAAKCAPNAHAKPRALIALDPVPFDAYLPYPGKLVSGADYERFKQHCGNKELSHEYATEGPRLDGGETATVLFGQYAQGSRRSCAHFINCAKGLGSSNCRWGNRKIDARFRETYPDLDPALARVHEGAAYPGVRVKKKKGIQPGEELLLDGYGPDFWQRIEQEASGTKLRILRPASLNPHQRALLEEGEPSRRGMKRLREL